MDLVSVIVTVQAGGRALSRCIDSVLNQSYYEVQLVLVLNGTVDDSVAICMDYAKRDSRVKVVHLERQSLRGARTAGLKVAFGEYVAFLNGQDTLDFYAIQRMHACLRDNKAQLCICGVKYMDDEKGLLYWEGPSCSRVVSDKEELRHKLVGDSYTYASVCHKEELRHKLVRDPHSYASITNVAKKHSKRQRNHSYWRLEENKLYWMGLFDAMVAPGGQGLEDDSILACVADRIDKAVLNPHRLYHYQMDEKSSPSVVGYKYSIPRNGRTRLLRSVLAQLCWTFVGWITFRIMK